MEKVIKAINTFFDAMEWKYSYDKEKSIFSTGVSMDGFIGNIALKIGVRETRYTVYAILNNKEIRR